MTDAQRQHDRFAADYSDLQPEEQLPTVSEWTITLRWDDASIDLPTWQIDCLDDGDGLMVPMAVEAVTGYVPLPTDRPVTVETPLEVVRDCKIAVAIEHDALTINIDANGGDGQ